MTIILTGLNHRTAQVELREKLSLSTAALHGAFAALRGESPSDISEVVVLSTCNRFEVYASADDPDSGAALVDRFLAGLVGLPAAEIEAHLYRRAGDAAVDHLMRVACGLDSMILGETQILGQVAHADQEARGAGLTGPVLSHLFAQAIHAGKRARTETPISRHTTSVSHAAALLLLEKLGGRRDVRVLVIGAGEMAVLAAQALRRFDLHDLTFVNRTYGRAEALAKAFGGRPLPWLQLDDALAWADAVICATGAPHTVIQRHNLESVMPWRDGRPLVAVDIAVPRDVEESVHTLPGVQVYDIDDLQSVVDGNLELRKAAVPQVEAVIAQELARFAEWYHGRQITPVIRTLREWAQAVAGEELADALNRLPGADERTRQVVSRMAYRLVNRLLHEPTSRLRVRASEGAGHGYAHAVRDLFALDALEPVVQDEITGIAPAEMPGAGH